MNTMQRRLPWMVMGAPLVILLVLLSACSVGQGGAPQSASSQGQQTTTQPARTIDWNQVGQALGKAGDMQPGDVYKVSLPRSDLQVTLGGVQLKPGFALGSHVEFKQMGNEAVAMGDLVLTAEEVNPVLSRLQQGGVELAALHNHLIGETPHVMYLHIHGRGDPVKLADTIHAALTQSKTPFTASASGTSADLGDLDPKQLDQILGRSGKVNGGIYQVSVPRAEKITDEGMEIPPAMGVATAINLQPTSGGKAAITGDFVLIAGEVNPVAKALRDNGIDVTALHSHALTETPRLFYMHFWANDDALKLARGLRAALDKTNSAKATP